MSRLPSAGSYSSQCPPSLATDMSSPTTFNSPDPNAAGPSQAGGASQWDPCGIAGPSFQQPDPLSIPASTPEVMASSFSSYNLYGASACYDLYGGESYYNPNDDQYQHGNPVTDTLFFGAGGQFASPTEENMGKMNQQTQDSYLKYYKFETKGANAPFWKLLPEYENTGLALTLPCSDDRWVTQLPG